MADIDILKARESPLVDVGSGHVNIGKLVEILNRNGIYNEIVGVNVEVEPELPVHFTSVCKFVTVKYLQSELRKMKKGSNRDINKLELFVKKLKANAEIKEEDEYSLFEKESNIYTQVMPALKELCESRVG